MRAWPAMVAVGSAVAVGLAGHTAVNLRFLRRLDPHAPEVAERVSIMVPARDEAAHVAATVSDLLAQSGLADVEVLVLDDGSTDATPAILDAMVDPRLHVIHAPDVPPPPGWLGKPWACHRMAQEATGSVLVFADADVDFAPEAVRAAVGTLRAGGFGLVCPWPRQVARTWPERVVQPLLLWSWAATMPLRWAERSLRASLVAANGQFVVVDARAYHAAGGHEGVRGEVLEDITLVRAVKRAGWHAATLDGTGLVQCRMYDSGAALVDGYAKSLWAAFGGPLGSAAVTALLVVAFVVPPVAAVAGPTAAVRGMGALGYLAGVASRALVARRTGEHLPDAVTHPASVAAYAVITGISWRRHRAGTNRWKGRTL